MISTADKAILGGTGAILTLLTGLSATFAVRMMSIDLPALTTPAQVVADLEKVVGRVKTRHRETLAWGDAIGRTPLREGDRIRTLEGAHASIRYDDGLVVTLEPNSQITVHGMVETGGEQRVRAIQVVDGNVRVAVAANGVVAIRDAAGRDQGEIRAVQGSGAAIALTAPEDIEEPIEIAMLEGHGEVVSAATGRRIVLAEGDTEIFPTSTPTPLAAVTKYATPVQTPRPKQFGGKPLQVVISETTDVRFRADLPPGVVEVSVRGRKCELYPPQFECSLFGLLPGVQSYDVLYKHSDGSYSYQPQQIRVR